MKNFFKIAAEGGGVHYHSLQNSLEIVENGHLVKAKINLPPFNFWRILSGIFQANLTIGAYRNEAGKPWVLPVVKKVCNYLSFGYFQ